MSTGMIGTKIQSYQITHFIGKGGHGAVYRACHAETGQEYALKVILPERTNDEKLRIRFEREAEIIRDLQHPNIVNLIDSWNDEDGLWVLMEWCGGGDLREYLDRHGKVEPHRLSAILNDIAGALDLAHAAGIVHRDMKPDNILLDDNGVAHLTDFGIAKRAGYSSITGKGMIVGSPDYLSPEQILGRELTPKVDIFALGIVIYELLSGEHPFAEIKEQLKMLMAIVREDVSPIIDLPDQWMIGLNNLIRRATAKDPDERFETVTELAQEFSRVLEEE